MQIRAKSVELILPMLRVVAKFCLRHGMRIHELETLLRHVFVGVVSEELSKKKQKSSTSRISVMTGLHRKEVEKYLGTSNLSELPLKESSRANVISNVLGQWQSDKRYLSKGTPKVLSYGSLDSEFNKLVDGVSQDLNAATVLFELQRIGAVEQSIEGIILAKRSYSPDGQTLPGFAIHADDMHHLSCAVEENLFDKPETTNLHMRTCFDGIRENVLPIIKTWLLKEGHELHARARAFLAEHDQDIAPDPTFNGRKFKVYLGAFSHTEPHEVD